MPRQSKVLNPIQVLDQWMRHNHLSFQQDSECVHIMYQSQYHTQGNASVPVRLPCPKFIGATHTNLLTQFERFLRMLPAEPYQVGALQSQNVIRSIEVIGHLNNVKIAVPLSFNVPTVKLTELEF